MSAVQPPTPPTKKASAEKAPRPQQQFFQQEEAVTQAAMPDEAPAPATPDDPSPDSTGTTAEIADPIERVLGHSVKLLSVIQARWPTTGRNYVAVEVAKALVRAHVYASRRANTPDEDPMLVTAADFVAGIVTSLDIGPGRWIERLTEELRSRAPVAMNALFESQPPGEIPNDLVDRSFDEKAVLRWDAVEILAEASELRAETSSGNQSIGLRHVAFAALFTVEGQRAFDELGLLGDELGPLIAALVDGFEEDEVSSYGDDPEAWQAVIGRAWSQGLLVERKVRPQSGFNPDTVLDEGEDVARLPDPLGTQADAAALADLILLEAARPPLAIGLFGSWGSGKSTLMRRVQMEIRRQTAILQSTDQVGSDPQTRRVCNVAQLEFNAWSFVDSKNLWASLTAEIFEQLRAGGGQQWARQQGQRLVEEVAQQVGLHEAEATRAREEKLQKLQQVEAAERALADLDQRKAREPHLTGFRRLLADPSSGLPDALRDYARQDESFDAPAILRRIRSTWSVLRRAKPLHLAIGVLGLVAGPILAIVWVRFGVTETISSWWAVAAGWGAAAAAIMRPLINLWPMIKAYDRALQEKRRELEQQSTVQREVLASARTGADQAAAREASSQARAADLMETTRDPARLLAYLLNDSSGIQAVRREVGLLSTIRHCFETLNAIIRSERRFKDSIDRIVLYVDDLDRCSASQVVKVLEAVHLLLAFECFVVVVAIDARWLRLSLERSHPQFQAVEGDKEGYSRPSPSDYLEKIFQVPFWVKPLQASIPDDSHRPAADPYALFLDQLLGPATIEAAKDGADQLDQDASGGAGGATVFVAVAPERPVDIEAQSERAERVRLTEEERDLLARLGPLAAKSPRAVKRLVNIYRLIRARIPAEQEADFLGAGSASLPSFASVQLILALDAGLPSRYFPDVRRAMVTLDPVQWDNFIADPGSVKTALMVGEPEQLSGLGLLRNRLESAGRIDGFVAAVAAATKARGGLLDREDVERAFALTQRYSFRAP